MFQNRPSLQELGGSGGFAALIEGPAHFLFSRSVFIYILKHNFCNTVLL